ncbi:hypothetical protein, partial [Propionivibrio sp.]|uniref:hypothetical protein n=1 Tax=Propionivibrio sp. TaxID=2212460 RepID=UPI003BF41628
RPEGWHRQPEEVLLGCALKVGIASLKKYSWGAHHQADQAHRCMRGIPRAQRKEFAHPTGLSIIFLRMAENRDQVFCFF